MSVPHTYQVNRLVELDALFIKIGEDTAPVLNVVDHGTTFQVATVLPEHNSHEVALAFQQRRVRYFGLPEVVLPDGGPEFGGDFERTMELNGVLHLI